MLLANHVKLHGNLDCSSTRIMVLQSSDCCWHHDYCVVSSCMFLGLNFKWKVIVLHRLHDNFIWLQRPWYWNYRWYWRYKFSLHTGVLVLVLQSFDFVSFSGVCHCRIRLTEWLLAPNKNQWVGNTSIKVYKHVGGYGTPPCRYNLLFIVTIINPLDAHALND